ncbi:MAG: CoA-binding protein [Anaerolineaceae bacterium]|nr:CoA-binding protein [Anaerolineaceae bacterium]
MLEVDFDNKDEDLRRILETSHVIAMVGESNDHYYSSYQVAQYLKEMGYKVYPVNPMISSAGGDRSYPTLADVPEPIDVVDVFRDPMYLHEIVDEAIAVGAKVLWAQLDVMTSDQAPERKAQQAGLRVVSNRCMRIEHERLKIPAKPLRKAGQLPR